MPIAFVLINADLGGEAGIISELKRMAEIKEAYEVYGVYDVVAKVEVDSMEGFNEVMKRVRGLGKVRSTLTMVAVTP